MENQKYIDFLKEFSSFFKEINKIHNNFDICQMLEKNLTFIYFFTNSKLHYYYQTGFSDEIVNFFDETLNFLTLFQLQTKVFKKIQRLNFKKGLHHKLPTLDTSI